MAGLPSGSYRVGTCHGAKRRPRGVLLHIPEPRCDPQTAQETLRFRPSPARFGCINRYPSRHCQADRIPATFERLDTGHEGLGEWTGRFDPGALVGGHCSCQTCCILASPLWSRRGGQRSLGRSRKWTRAASRPRLPYGDNYRESKVNRHRGHSTLYWSTPLMSPRIIRIRQ